MSGRSGWTSKYCFARYRRSSRDRERHEAGRGSERMKWQLRLTGASDRERGGEIADNERRFRYEDEPGLTACGPIVLLFCRRRAANDDNAVAFESGCGATGGLLWLRATPFDPGLFEFCARQGTNRCGNFNHFCGLASGLAVPAD